MVFSTPIFFGKKVIGKLALSLTGSIVLGFIISIILFPDPVCLADEKEVAPRDESAGDNVSRNEVEVAVFMNREEAKKLAEKIRGSGFETLVRGYNAKDDRTVYGVFVIIHTGSLAGARKPGLPPETGTPGETSRTPRDIFSRSASYFHAGLTVSEIYTDNAFNTKTDKKSDLGTVLSPDVWISVPRVDQKPEGLSFIEPRSPGGLALSRQKGEGTRRYQAFMLLQSDIPLHSENSPSGNTVTYNLQGGFAYNSLSGLSIEVNDEFSRYYETADTFVLLPPGEVDRYKSNLFYALLSYDTGNRLRFRLDYSHFLLNFDEERNSLRDRADNSLSTYIFYKLRPKTALFFEYAFSDIGYSNDNTLNSRGNNFFLGVEWDVTAKSKGSVKAGYGLRDFDDSATNNKTFVFEGKVEHKFTPKTSLKLTASRRTDETNIPSTFFVLTNAFELNYQQMLTSKITGYVDLGYTRESYGEDLTFEGMTAKRRDDIYQASLGVQYAFRKWLKAGIAYSYTTRDSNFPDFNYSTNTLWLRLTGSL